MVVLIPEDRGSSVSRVIIYVIVIVVILLAIWGLYLYVYRPWREGKIFQPTKVTCTVGPSPPLNVTAVAQPNNRGLITWNASANTDSYILYMGNYSNFGIADAERVIPVKGTSIVVLNLVPKTYYFKVAAVNSCGTSSVSAEAPLPVTTWPSTFKLCKRDAPTTCLLFQGNDQFALMSNSCTFNRCTMTYENLQQIKRADANLCLRANDQPGVDIENPVTSSDCASAGNWSIDVPTGRITNAAGLCFGADSNDGTAAYNTQCSVISNPQDARYAWEVIALTN